MNLSYLLGLLGGLALFLYGMQMMSDGLEGAVGNKMKKVLATLTANRFVGVLAGALITAVIQSSSATTVMVVGFVNSGMMTLNQAVWIIMGANIGTTITGQLVALDVGMLAPLFAFLGVVMMMFIKNPKSHHIGKVLAGFGVLFIGMDMMGAAMAPLQDSPAFVSLMTSFSNPILAIIAGALFTAIIQSSSASVGILQTLASNGLISFSSSVFVLFGQNIGTCITAVLASIGMNKNAKRTTVIHLLFNIIGTIIFTTACLLFPLADFVGSLTPGAPASQIANMHTLFNIVTTILLIPFGQYLARLAVIILPDGKEEKAASLDDELMLSNYTLGNSAIHLDLMKQEVSKMLKATRKNVEGSFDIIMTYDTEKAEKIAQREERIDAFNKNISKFISKAIGVDSNDKNLRTMNEYFLILSNIERIGDHAMNIAGYGKELYDEAISLTDPTLKEVAKMKEITLEAIDVLSQNYDDDRLWLSKVASLEQRMDDMNREYRTNHLYRMNHQECSELGSVVYFEMLMDFERIGDHVLNIAQAMCKENYA
ncbi:MAG: Na/Pi cotransporter family protein [Erysipelotrichaceae bacterium]|nr:Na/Pi cotransporter family protein [Erysipelotrichaceae bacterium]MDY5253021.1 Na/Pi cotransporter family protein [Erysipelotrichaceae bacterium]